MMNKTAHVDRPCTWSGVLLVLLAVTILASGQRALVFHYRNSGKPINVDGGRRLCYT